MLPSIYWSGKEPSFRLCFSPNFPYFRKSALKKLSVRNLPSHKQGLKFIIFIAACRRFVSMNLDYNNPPLPQRQGFRCTSRLGTLWVSFSLWVRLCHTLKTFFKLNEKSLTLQFSDDDRFESNREHLNFWRI